MTIGEKIRFLRKENDITQEKLADYLNISYQAVSKWENNAAMPDISLVVPLANFFGVSADVLFDLDGQARTAELEAFNREDKILSNKGFVKERVALWRRAVLKYPKNYDCLLSLASILWNAGAICIIYDEEENQRCIEEAVRICNRILEDCTDNSTRGGAIQILVFIYGREDSPFADEEKAVKTALMADTMYVSSDFLLEHAYFTEEGVKKARAQRHRNILNFMDGINLSIAVPRYPDPKEGIFALESMLRLWDTLIYDGNFLFFHCRLADLCLELGRQHAKLSDRDNALKYLNRAARHSREYDSIPEGEHYYTSVFVSGTYHSPSHVSRNYTGTHSDMLKKRLSDGAFDFLREDGAFAGLLAELG